MTRFVFALQPVFELRKQEEKEQKGRLGQARKKLLELLAEADALEAEYARRSRRFLEEAQAGVGVPDAVRTSVYFNGLCGRLEESRRKAEAQRAEVERQRAKLEMCIRERRVFEKLRERQYERYLKDAQRGQEKELEDAVAARLPGQKQTA